MPEIQSFHLLTLHEPGAKPLIGAKAFMAVDPRSVELLQQVERISRSDAPVLLIGETGTGKELVARHIHTLSGRKGPFLAVNCGAFSESLIDAELFGHEAGAFTGAQRAREGWFEAAEGGTLFLDEIGDLSPGLQVKLLRVLQERQVVRIGSRKAVQFDVRVIAATNVDLRQAVDAQQFRADLYYRLCVATVSLPPLRERAGDVIPLARHFLGVYGPRLGLPAVQLAPDALDALLQHAWPGNIRELENVIHFALIVCRNGVIHARDFNLSARAAALAPPAVDAAAAAASVGAAKDGETASGDRLRSAYAALLHEATPALFALAEATLVRAAFAHARENQVRTARVLGITRNTLRTLLKRHGLLDAAVNDALAEPPDSASP